MPDGPERLRVLVIAPYLNGEGLGEVYSIFRWVEALARRVDATVLTLSRDDRLVRQLPDVRAVIFNEPGTLGRVPRLNAMAKPWVPIFFGKARRWIATAQARGEHWDIVHQVLPQAMRYAAPWHKLGLPYVVGPLGGSLDTPQGFRTEVREAGLAARLRRLDRWRLRHDPALRKGYEAAGLVLGVAPYVHDALSEAQLTLTRFEPMLERAHEGAVRQVVRTSGAGEAHLLHVGRGVRTKGLRDVVRALALLPDLQGVRLTSAGSGPEIEAARIEARDRGVADRIEFLGQVPRSEVDRLYGEADIFAFPSFREPMGGVFFEAMEWGLPIITAARGGPDFILDDTCAFKLPVETPEQFASDIADAIRRLALDPVLRRRMGQASTDRLRSFGGWDDRAAALETLYREVIAA